MRGLAPTLAPQLGNTRLPYIPLLMSPIKFQSTLYQILALFKNLCG